MKATSDRGGMIDPLPSETPRAYRSARTEAPDGSTPSQYPVARAGGRTNQHH
jgi:hypothetical protein